MALPGIIKNSFYLIILLFFWSCDNNNNNQAPIVKKQTNQKDIYVPNFDTDSAYFFVEQQVLFGPRVPNSNAHNECFVFLKNKLNKLGATVSTQIDYVERFDGYRMKMKNIIASYNPNSIKRILLCAHWDSRYTADNDTVDVDKPILGANDGGSGVGVLLEIARQIQLHPITDLGIDIIFFDVEDQGAPNNVLNASPNSWCLGSQYWSLNPHIKNYFADFGILLDMVAGKDAKFTKEGVSVQFASRFVDKIWDTADELGYSNFFSTRKTPPIIDDHLYINNLIHIPTVNIVEFDENSHNRFNKHHHKHSDDMTNIDKKTMKAVGQTVLNVIYTY